MKKIISLVLILTLSLFAFAACGGKDNDDNDNTPTEKNYSLAIGVATTQSGEKVTNTVAALVIEDGKIVFALVLFKNGVDGVKGRGKRLHKDESLHVDDEH